MKKSIVKILLLVTGVYLYYKTIEFADNCLKDLKRKFYKEERYRRILNQWLMLKNSDNKICDYFKANNYYRIAIYGYSELGRRLYEELNNVSEYYVCFIDRKASIISNKEIDIVGLEGKIDNIDVIVVSPVCEFNAISDELRDTMSCPIISLEDILYSI